MSDLAVQLGSFCFATQPHMCIQYIHGLNGFRTSLLRFGEELSATTSVSGSEWSSDFGDSERGGGREVWAGELSSVIGLQKRGLRGLMEGRRMRERTGTSNTIGTNAPTQQRQVGLGIASS